MRWKDGIQTWGAWPTVVANQWRYFLQSMVWERRSQELLTLKEEEAKEAVLGRDQGLRGGSKA